MIRARYIGNEYSVILQKGRVYDVLEVADIFGDSKLPFYKIRDEDGDLSYFPWCDFEIIEETSDIAVHGIGNNV